MAMSQTLARVPRLPRFWDVRGWRIGAKLLATFLFVLLVPLLVTAAVTVSASRNALLAQGDFALASMSANTSTSIDSYLRIHRDNIRVMGEMPEIIAYTSNPSDATAKTNALLALKAAANRPEYETVAIATPDGKQILSSSAADIGINIQFRPYFQGALNGTAYISDPSVSIATNQPAIFFSAPIRNAVGNIVGVVRSRLNLTGIWALVENDNGAAGTGSIGILLDENGIRLAHSTSKGNRTAAQETLLFRAIAPLPNDVVQALVAEKRFGAATTDRVEVLPLPEVAAALQGAHDKVFQSTGDKSSVRHEATLTRLQVKPWSYVMMAPTPTFTSTADNLLIFYIFAIVIVGAFATIFALVAARSISTPIVQLTHVADRISLGELDAKIEINRRDEIGELAEAVRRMQASLRAAMERWRARRTT